MSTVSYVSTTYFMYYFDFGSLQFPKGVPVSRSLFVSGMILEQMMSEHTSEKGVGEGDVVSDKVVY